MSNLQKLLKPFRDTARTECFCSVSDSNLGAVETMHNAKYPLELFQPRFAGGKDNGGLLKKRGILR
ncbi:MAG: hypothetical protein GXY61_08255 [Lentisphaerae bacterium]|jgi:hypothetical protein|nr:hypothetical protein [Lentisphaerota bacterium]